MSTWSNLNLQNSNSPMMEQLSFFHDHALLILILITSFITYMFLLMFFNKFINRNLLHSQMIEMIWTILPIFILLFIAFPSLRILYMMDEINNPMISIKSIGHQWYWSYEYSDFPMIEFDSYMIPSKELKSFHFRLLEVDNRLILPIKSQIRILITSTDVIHSWTVPCLGIKVDGSPGRLNQTNFYINRPGIFFGQCSEICGMNHSFMPIIVESIPMNKFLNWLKK
uniref:cytochrome c oxidase subunit II n=1 Tax=Stenochironomus okialbus TaxID=1481661 RepID=UPI001FAEE38D|nr:cytochrome c oxidase subunit II [Stenochironomus okialbus]UKO32996.1 cytochrome c oxidase subunit II [Stenochironomus okialbus]